MLTRRADGRFCKSKTINGKKVYFYSTEPTERKAAKDIENQLIAYTEKEEKGKTFGEVADEWEEHHYKNVQWQTSNRYKSLVTHLNEKFVDVYIKQIKPKDIQTFLEKYAKDGFSTKSLTMLLSVCKMIFKYAVIKEYITTNPSEYLTPPKGKPKQTREALTDEQINIIKNNTDSQFGFLAFFLLYTGMRRGEALALTYGDIDFDNNVINVNKSVEYRGNTPYLKTPKTEAGYRQIPLLDILKNKLPKGKENELIFSQRGNLISKSYFEDNWNAYCKRTGIKITAHQLRHTYTTLLFEWNIDVKDSQEILGHADISTTRNIYTHIRKSRIQNTTSKINSILAGE